MSKYDDEGLRRGEREWLDAARAGRADPADMEALIARLGRTRIGRDKALEASRARDPLADRLELFDDVCKAFQIAMQSVHELSERTASLERKLEKGRDEIPKGVMSELVRLQNERDEFRQAAREADAQRLAVLRRASSVGNGRVAEWYVQSSNGGTDDT